MQERPWCRGASWTVSVMTCCGTCTATPTVTVPPVSSPQTQWNRSDTGSMLELTSWGMGPFKIKKCLKNVVLE